MNKFNKWEMKLHKENNSFYYNLYQLNNKLHHLIAVIGEELGITKLLRFICQKDCND